MNLQIFGANPAVFARHEVVFHRLSVLQSANARFVNGGNVDKHVFAALRGTNKAESFGQIESFYRTSAHFSFPFVKH